MRKNVFARLLLVCILTAIFSLSGSHLALAFEKEINSLAATMAENIARSGKKTIAVVDFTDLQGNVTELGRFLAEEFSVALLGTGKGFEVVDRTHLKALLQEHKLSLTGLIDPKTARKLGQIAGVEALLTGTITAFGDSVRLSIKILDPTTAKVIGAARGNIAKTKAIEELLARGIVSGQPFGQQASTASYVPSAWSSKSKRVGDITVTMKRIMVSKGQVMVALDFLNHSDKELILARAGGYKPDLIDEKGNIFEYDSGLYGVGYSWNSGKYISLNPKSNNDLSLLFEGYDIKKTGSIFSFSLKYTVYNPEANSSSTYEVTFSDIKAQVPR